MTSKLITKVNKQYKIGSPLLLLFSAPFIVWQMGVLYFSGNTMSLFGRTPIPLTGSSTALVIVAGYASCILAVLLFPRKVVWMERALLPCALIATLLMLYPFSAAVVTALFYVSAFVCVFSIGASMSVAAQHFTVETTWRDGIISMVAGGTLIAVLQNDFFEVSFTAFTVFSVLLIIAQTVFYYLIPSKIEVTYVSRENKVKMPRILFFGIWLISNFSTLLICFASSFAESVRGGVSIIYLSAAAMAILLFILRKKLVARAVRVFGGFFALSVFGFVLAFLSLSLKVFQPVACVLLGFAVVLANMWIYFGAVAFRVYPTRFIGAIGAATGFAIAMFHSALQSGLRDEIPVLYGIYAALSVALLLIYNFMEPYFIRVFQKDREAPPAPAAKSSAIPDMSALHPPEAAPHAFDVLSEQERILAGLILDGHTETSAAGIMNISLNTQKGYRKNLYSKLNIHSKRELFELTKN